MDFTALHAVSHPSHLKFSPGSTFILSLVEQRSIVVRAAQDLSLVRVWSLPDDCAEIDRVAWSPDGSYILAASTSRAGSSAQADDNTASIHVFVLDPRKQATAQQQHAAQSYGFDHGEEKSEAAIATAVARLEESGSAMLLEPGAAGLSHVQWVGPGSIPPTVLSFSDNETGIASFHCLADGSSAMLKDVKLPRAFPHPKDRSLLALLHRNAHTGEEVVGLYRFDAKAATSEPHPGSRSPTKGSYTALLAGMTSVASKESNLASYWQLETSFPCRTNDAASLSWSPDGTLLAVWETEMEYKLHLFTGMGHSRGTLTIAEGLGVVDLPAGRRGEAAVFHPELDVSSSAANKSSLGTTHPIKVAESGEALDATHLAGGGLGIRAVAWQPSSETSIGLLAVGGYDEKVHILSPTAEHDDWGVLVTLDLSRRTFHSSVSRPAPHKSKTGFQARVYREPRGWIERSGRRGIVEFDFDDREHGGFPVTVPALKPDWDKANPKAGICWLDWDPAGVYLAVRNEAMPSALLIYTVSQTTGSHNDSSPPTLSLASVVLFASAISAATWKSARAAEERSMPSPPPDQPLSTAQLAVVTSASSAVYLWTGPGNERGAVTMEGVPVPLPPSTGDDSSDVEFQPSWVRFSADGRKMAIASSASSTGVGSYCVAVVIDDD